MVGRLLGCFNGGGATFGIHGGAHRGVRYDYGAFFTSKNAIFLFGHSSEHDK
mgnify:CR=1 FL=1